MEFWLSVSGVAIIVIMIIVACVLWKVTKILLIPIQILLFLALAFIVYKLLFTPETIDMISKGINDKNMQELVNKASESAKKAESAISQKISQKIHDSTKAAIQATPRL